MAAADSVPILMERVSLYQTDISLLNQLTVTLKAKDSVSMAIAKSYETQLTIHAEQRALYDVELNNMRNLYKKERRKRIWTQVFAIVGISGALFLGLNL